MIAWPQRRQIVQWPIMGPWRGLRYHFYSHLGAGLYAGGQPIERDPMGHDGCTPTLG